MRKAFTMLEMVFVIVITGLVAVAGSMAIVQIMQNYAIQKEYAKMELDGTSAILQISKYLQDSVWDSIAIKNNNNYDDISHINTRDAGHIKDGKELVFISKNMDALNGYFGTHHGSGSNLPFFSGFIDLSQSNGTSLTTAFSQDKLSSLKNLVGKIGVYFPFVNKDGKVIDKYYSNNSSNNSKALFKINSIASDTQMTLDSSPSKIGDIAIIVNTTPFSLKTNSSGDLILNYDTDHTLAQGVSNFYIWSEAQSGLLRVRLCFTNKTMDFMPEFCKEGVIMQ